VQTVLGVSAHYRGFFPNSARIDHVEPAQMKHLEEVFDQCGGIPCICLRFLRRPDLLGRHRTAYEDEIRGMGFQVLRDYTFQAMTLQFDKVPHTVFLVERSSLDDLRSRTVVVPASSLVRANLKSQIRKLWQADQIQLYEQFASMEPSGRMAGVVFESLARSILQRRVALELVPMQRRSSGPRREVLWVSTSESGDQSSSHTVEPSDVDHEWENGQSALVVQGSAQAGPEEVHSSVTIDFQPSCTVEYEGSTIERI
jgi:hypothetical protein